MTFRELQEQQRPWVAHNFPGRDWIAPTLGVVEEMGELAHALLKQRQGIRGSSEEHEAKAKDAVADIVIFLADLCSARGWDFEAIVEQTWAHVSKRDWRADPANGEAVGR